MSTPPLLAGRYRMGKAIAQGGMATVYTAEDTVLSRPVAVKILRAELALDETLRARFHDEAVAAGRLSHPNIVRVYDTGDDHGLVFIVMELVRGATLRTVIARGPLPLYETMHIGAQIAGALDVAHNAGIIHRDVKPSNVLVPDPRNVKVADFGIAKSPRTSELAREGAVLGTTRYLAPEQVEGRPVDPRTDIYALGLVIFEMLSGFAPFTGDGDVTTALARLTTTAPSLRDVRHDIPESVDDLVHRCVARDTRARPRSAAALRAALLDCARAVESGTDPTPG